MLREELRPDKNYRHIVCVTFEEFRIVIDIYLVQLRAKFGEQGCDRGLRFVA